MSCKWCGSWGCPEGDGAGGEQGIEARFVGGPWEGRHDLRVRPGTRTVNAFMGAGPYYEYQGHGSYRDGRAWVQYEWTGTATIGELGAALQKLVDAVTWSDCYKHLPDDVLKDVRQALGDSR